MTGKLSLRVQRWTPVAAQQVFVISRLITFKNKNIFKRICIITAYLAIFLIVTISCLGESNSPEINAETKINKQVDD